MTLLAGRRPVVGRMVRGLADRDRWVSGLLIVAAVLGVPVLALAATLYRPSLVIVGLLLAAAAGLVLVAAAPGAVVPTAWVLIVFVGLVRKVVAGSSGHVENDPLIALPFVLLLPFLVSRIWWSRRNRAHVWFTVLFAAVVAVSFVVAVVMNGPNLVMIRSFVQEFAVPMTAVALTHPALRGSLRATMTTVRITTVIAGLYGIVQFVSPAPWDMRWLRNLVFDQGIQSFGVPEVGRFRLFGPLTSPLEFATVLSAGILCWAFCEVRVVWRVAAIAVMVPPLLLTQVRTSVFALAIALAVGALLHYRQRAVVPLIAVGGGLAAIPLILQAIAPDIVNRFSLSDLNSDVSYNARLHLIDRTIGSIFGMGGGPGSSNNGSITTDNGYLAVFIEFGFIGGAIFLALLVAALVRAGEVALDPAVRERGLPFAMVLLFLLSEAGAPVIQGDQGLVFWVALAAVGSIAARDGTGSGELDDRSGRRPAALEPVGSVPAPV